MASALPDVKTLCEGAGQCVFHMLYNKLSKIGFAAEVNFHEPILDKEEDNRTETDFVHL